LPKFSGWRKDRRRRIGSEPIPVTTRTFIRVSFTLFLIVLHDLSAGLMMWRLMHMMWLMHWTPHFTVCNGHKTPWQVCKTSFHTSIVQLPNALSNDEVTLDYCLFDGVVSRRGMGDPKLQE
jgi:hypothetical protein